MKYSLFIFLLFTQLVAQSQDWTQIDVGTTEQLNQAYFVDEATGFIVGHNGTLLRTNDGGDNWTLLPAGVSHNLFTISFADENIGYINGLKTTDGGETWTTQSSTEVYGLIYALDQDNLIAGLADSFSGDIYKSEDSGENWEVLTNPISPLAGAYNDVCFVNESIGYLSAWYSDHLVQTIDGGDTWSEIMIDIVDGADFFSDDFRSVYFASEEIGVLTHESGILKTSDGGSTWSEIKPVDAHTSFYAESVIANSTENYIVAGRIFGDTDENEKIYETTDGGLNWILSVQTNEELFDVVCTSNNCFTVGSNGAVFAKTNDLVNASELLERTEISVYPSPVKEFLFIDSDVRFEEVQVVDVMGIVYAFYSNGADGIDVSDLADGVYFLKLSVGEEEEVFKFVKQ